MNWKKLLYNLNPKLDDNLDHILYVNKNENSTYKVNISGLKADIFILIEKALKSKLREAMESVIEPPLLEEFDSEYERGLVDGRNNGIKMTKQNIDKFFKEE